MNHLTKACYTLVVACASLPAAAQWTEVKDVNGKTHTIYKTPVAAPATATRPSNNTTTTTQQTVEPAKPKSSSGGSIDHTYNAATGRYIYILVDDEYHDGNRLVRGDAGYGYIDGGERLVIPMQYEHATSFSEGYAAVEKDGKYGFIDVTGKVVIPFKYDDAYESISDGLAAVKLNGQWGYIDINDNIQVPFQYEGAGIFNILGCVSVNGKWGFVNRTGKLVISCKYEEQTKVAGDAIVVKLNGLYGYINMKGKELCPIKYQIVKPLKYGGFGEMFLDGKWESLTISKRKLY